MSKISLNDLSRETKYATEVDLSVGELGPDNGKWFDLKKDHTVDICTMTDAELVDKYEGLNEYVELMVSVSEKWDIPIADNVLRCAERRDMFLSMIRKRKIDKCTSDGD